MQGVPGCREHAAITGVAVSFRAAWVKGDPTWGHFPWFSHQNG